MTRTEAPGEAVPKGLGVVLVSSILLCAIGLLSAWHLVEVYRQTHLDPEEYRSFCNLSESMNCDKVALHDEFSVVLGTPVAVWAMAGYAFVALLTALALVRARSRFGQGFLFLNGVLFVGVSLWLVYVMHFEIGAWCIVCLAIDVINLSLFGLSLAAIRVSRVSVAGAIRADVRSLLARPLLAAGLAVLGAGLLAGAWFGGQRLQDSIAQARAARQGPRKAGEDPRPAQMLYVSREDERLEADAWSRRTQDTPRDQACLDKGAGAGPDAPVRIAFGTSAEGYPWKGAEQPSVEIHEFTDFQCPYCRSAHLLVNRLVSRYPGQLRVYHRHLPLDNRCNRKLDRPFHPRACELSLIAVCAGQQGRFWEMTDYLFHNSQAIRAQGPSAEDIARALALDLGKFNCCMGDPQSMRPVEADLAAAASLNLRGTPAFVIQGQVYYGKIPDEALRVLDPPSP